MYVHVVCIRIVRACTYVHIAFACVIVYFLFLQDSDDEEVSEEEKMDDTTGEDKNCKVIIVVVVLACVRAARASVCAPVCARVGGSLNSFKHKIKEDYFI